MRICFTSDYIVISALHAHIIHYVTHEVHRCFTPFT